MPYRRRPAPPPAPQAFAKLRVAGEAFVGNASWDYQEYLGWAKARS